MTEEEARTKWCPQTSRFIEGEIPEESRPKLFNCYASECMWWVEDNFDQPLVQGHCGAIK